MALAHRPPFDLLKKKQNYIDLKLYFFTFPLLILKIISFCILTAASAATITGAHQCAFLTKTAKESRADCASRRISCALPHVDVLKPHTSSTASRQPNKAAQLM